MHPIFEICSKKNFLFTFNLLLLAYMELLINHIKLVENQ